MHPKASGRWFDFCDENVDTSTSEIFSYVDNASYIFTNTFNGLMFYIALEPIKKQ